MNLSQHTKELLSAIHNSSGGKLQRSLDLGVLIELAVQENIQHALDDLAFFAKFLSKTFELMKRIGRGGEGYEKLEAEFTLNTKKARRLIQEMISIAPADVKATFENNYLSMNPNTMSNLMTLFNDLSWYKNYKNDVRSSNE